MLIIYKKLTYLLYPIFVLIIFLRRFLKKEDWNRYKEKIFSSNFNKERNANKKLIWFHASSVGEMKSILPIIKELNNYNKKFEFLITTVTLSSGNLATDEIKKFDNVKHRYFPIDVDFLIKKFLETWKPDYVFLVDSEIWPNLVLTVKEKKIPLGIINARITQKSFKRWKWIKKTAKKVFSSFDLCLTSNKETQNYLKEFDVKNIYNSGNIKLISSIERSNFQNENGKILANKKFWLAVSTHRGEERLCLNTHVLLKNKFSSIKTIIAPRHINRSEEIKSLCKKFNLEAQILDKGGIISDQKEIIILNTFGELNKYFNICRSVFIGKSTLKRLEKDSGQNPIDAAKLGCKIYHGPFVYNFKEIYELLDKNNISKEINNSEDLFKNLTNDFENSNKDSTKVILLMNSLENETLKNTMKHINYFLSHESV